jgi:hypothetical protein
MPNVRLIASKIHPPSQYRIARCARSHHVPKEAQATDHDCLKTMPRAPHTGWSVSCAARSIAELKRYLFAARDVEEESVDHRPSRVPWPAGFDHSPVTPSMRSRSRSACPLWRAYSSIMWR